ncbi:unnamed protein product, partial [marine sediment metagenome]
MEIELSGVKIKELLEHSLVMIREKRIKHNISCDIKLSKKSEKLEITA